MKFKTLIGLLAISMNIDAFAGTSIDLSGNHEGKVANDKSYIIDFILRKVEGRSGSYFGVLIKREKEIFQSFNPLKIALYMVDPLDSENSYTLTPLVVTPDGSIGVNNADPSLVLNITGNTEAEKKPEFTLASANSSNRNGFQESMIFEKGEKSDAEWISMEGGKYELDGDGSKTATTVSNMDSNFEATTSFMTKRDLNGDYIIQEKQPWIYVLKARTVTSTGVEAEQNPKKVGIMIKYKKTFGTSDKYLLFVDASFANHITRLEKKD